MTLDLVLPNWRVPLPGRPVLSDQAYLAWLDEERARLLGTEEFERLRTDPLRCPVDERFTLE